MSEAAVRAYGREKHFSEAILRRWSSHAEADRDALLALVRELRLGENQLRDVLDSLEDIAARQRSSVAAVLGSAAVRAVRNRHLGRNEAIKAVKRCLRCLRYPQLTAAEERLASLAKRLRLPAGVKVEYPEHLEGQHVTVTIRACSAAELRARAAALVGVSQAGEIEEMLAILGGDW